MEISGGINQLLESLNQIHITNEADKGLIEVNINYSRS